MGGILAVNRTDMGGGRFIIPHPRLHQDHVCATEPNGPIRDRLEIERTNLVIGLFVARIAAMRVSSSEPMPEALSEPNVPIARRG
jgi:hypothetical protein